MFLNIEICKCLDPNLPSVKNFQPSSHDRTNVSCVLGSPYSQGTWVIHPMLVQHVPWGPGYMLDLLYSIAQGLGYTIQYTAGSRGELPANTRPSPNVVLTLKQHWMNIFCLLGTWCTGDSGSNGCHSLLKNDRLRWSKLWRIARLVTNWRNVWPALWMLLRYWQNCEVSNNQE